MCIEPEDLDRDREEAEREIEEAFPGLLIGNEDDDWIDDDWNDILDEDDDDDV